VKILCAPRHCNGLNSLILPLPFYGGKAKEVAIARRPSCIEEDIR